MVEKMVGAGKRSRPTDDDYDDDLLQHLDFAYRREKERAWRRVSRQCKVLENERIFHDTMRSSAESISHLHPVSEDDQARCMKELQSALGAEGLDECVCLVCDRLVLPCKKLQKEGSDWKYVALLRECLGETADDIPKRLVDQYCAPPHVEGLENGMVSPRGLHCYIDENECPVAWMSICKECDESIRFHNLPKFAISNGFFVGRLPDRLRRLTIPERFMIQLASIGAMKCVMGGGQHRFIRSHCVAFDCTPGPPVSLLPRSIDQVDSYRVVMVGDFTEVQVRKVKKMHRIRNNIVRDLFGFYKTYNHLYGNVFPCDEILDAEYNDETIDNHFVEHVSDDNNCFEEAMDIEQETFEVVPMRGEYFVKVMNKVF